MNLKEKYRQLCLQESSIPIFSRDWWLDSVAGEANWDVVMVENSGEVLGCFPYTFRKKIGFRIITMPRLTPWLYIYLNYPAEQKYTRRLAFQKKILTQLIEQLPDAVSFHQKYHYSLTNWLPFYWKGFRQTTRYSYVIEDLSDPGKIFRDFRDNIRREIRKAEKKVMVEETEDVALFFSLATRTFQRQNKTITFSQELMEKLDQELVRRDQRKIYLARDKNNQTVHAGLYLIWDENSAYYLAGGADPALRSSGASSLLMWTAIQFAATVTKKFDFEGSMIEPIERFFRAFGANQKPYFSIYKRKFPFSLLNLFS